MGKYKNLFVIGLFLNCFVAMGCISIKPIYYDDDKQLAQKKIETFHQLFNDEKYDEIYNVFTPKIQKAQSKEQFIAALQKLHLEAGKVKNSELIKADVKPQASFRIVHMFFKTNFEKENRNEEFDCLVDEQTVVIDYYGQPETIPNLP